MVALNLTLQGMSSVMSGLALIALGVALLRVAPRSREARSLALFALAFGLGFVANNALHLTDPAWPLTAWITLPAWGAATVVAVDLALRLPTRVPPRDRKLLAIASVPGILVAIVGPISLWTRSAVVGERLGIPPSALPTALAVTTVLFVLVGTLVSFLFLLAMRHTRLGSPAERAQTRLIAAALLTYPGFWIGSWGRFGMDSELLAFGIVLLILLAGLWLRAPPTPSEARGMRSVAWVALAAPLLAMTEDVFLQGGYLGGLSVGSGLSRVAMVAVLAYAVVRHQLLGIDVKLRWTISKSTIAAVFIAVFFIASETAQQFFGETLGSAYVGIAAAGALVFALAPLQRVAERLAEKAVPVAAPPSAPASPNGTDRESIYRDALRLALRDRKLTRTEEAQLHRLAEALGIRPARAHEMLAEVEAEPGGGG